MKEVEKPHSVSHFFQKDQSYHSFSLRNFLESQDSLFEEKESAGRAADGFIEGSKVPKKKKKKKKANSGQEQDPDIFVGTNEIKHVETNIIKHDETTKLFLFVVFACVLACLGSFTDYLPFIMAKEKSPSPNNPDSVPAFKGFVI